MQFHLELIGVLLVVLGAGHAIFPRYFNWKTELTTLSLINRQVMKVHTFFIALVVVLIGLLCFIEADALQHTPLGQTLAKGLAFFWGCRLLIQLVGYSSKLWKGKPFETLVHVVFTFFWCYITTVFFLVGFGLDSLG